MLESAEDRLGRAIELCEYFVASPNGWVGEGQECAQDILDVLNGGPIPEWCRTGD